MDDDTNTEQPTDATAGQQLAQYHALWQQILDGERRKSPVSKPRIPRRQANVMLFFASKQQMFQAFSRFAAGSVGNCLD